MSIHFVPGNILDLAKGVITGYLLSKNHTLEM